MWPFVKRIDDEPLAEQYADAVAAPFLATRLQRECDTLPGAYGAFGHSQTNPIPVNGPTGEIKYLNRLVLNNALICYHRLGCVRPILPIPGNIDVYEIVVPETNEWDILFFHMYHPRRSTKRPKGYVRRAYKDVNAVPIGPGTNSRCQNFPYDIPSLLVDRFDRFGVMLAFNLEKLLEKYPNLSRPEQHSQRLNTINLISLEEHTTAGEHGNVDTPEDTLEIGYNRDGVYFINKHQEVAGVVGIDAEATWKIIAYHDNNALTILAMMATVNTLQRLSANESAWANLTPNKKSYERAAMTAQLVLLCLYEEYVIGNRVVDESLMPAILLLQKTELRLSALNVDDHVKHVILDVFDEVLSP